MLKGHHWLACSSGSFWLFGVFGVVWGCWWLVGAVWGCLGLSGVELVGVVWVCLGLFGVVWGCLVLLRVVGGYLGLFVLFGVLAVCSGPAPGQQFQQFQHFNISTFQYFNDISTFQHFNISTFPSLCNISTFEKLHSSTSQYSNMLIQQSTLRNPNLTSIF